MRMGYVPDGFGEQPDVCFGMPAKPLKPLASADPVAEPEAINDLCLRSQKNIAEANKLIDALRSLITAASGALSKLRGSGGC
jgi:hypothetical protein